MSPLERDRLVEGVLNEVQKEILDEIDLAYPEDIQRVINDLCEHLFKEDCNVNSILERTNVSKARIHARFKYHVGTSIRCYLEERRFNAVLKLIKYEELDIFAIAISVGFSNYRFFGRAFRRIMGSNPMEYRNKMSSENVH